MAQPELAKFFSEKKTPPNLPNSEYFFIVILTVDHDYLDAVIKHSNQLLFAGKKLQDVKNLIEVNKQKQK